jgi:hypothetical protein
VTPTVKIRYRHPDTGAAEIHTVPAFPCGVPGLMICPAGDTPGWIITHARSGLGLMWFPGAGPEAVLAAAQEIGQLTDWTASAHSMHADMGLRAAVLDAGGKWGGCLYCQRVSSEDFDDLPAGAA